MNWIYTNLNRCRAHLRARHFLKRLFLTNLLLISSVSFATNTENTKQKYKLHKVISPVVLLLGGTWLAYKQLPYLVNDIRCDAPELTKIISSLLFSLGITASVTGTGELASMIQNKLNMRLRISFEIK